MKKFYFFIAFALMAFVVCAQEPLYTFETTVTNDASWGEEWASYFVLQDTKVTVEVYDDDYVIIRNWGGTEGNDLKVEYDSSIDTEAENCLGNIINVVNIYDGVEAEPVAYQGYYYSYTGRNDEYAVCATYINEDGTLYWSFVNVDKENKTGSVLLSGYYCDSDYTSYSSSNLYYYVEWPYEETEKEPVFYGKFKGYVTEMEETDEYFKDAFMKDYTVSIDVYDKYIIIHNYSNSPDDPRDIKLTWDGTDNQYITSIVHTRLSNGKETDLTVGGYLYTGLSSIDGNNYINSIYLYSCADGGYNYASWDETSGYVTLYGASYSKDADGNKIDGYNYGYYYLYWNGELAEPEKLYSAQGEFISQEDESGYLYVGEKADIEVYDDNSIIVRNFAGVEGSDLKVNYDENQYVTGVSQIVNGEQGEVTTDGWFTFEPGDGQTHYIWVGENGGYNYSWATSREDQSGYVFLYVYNEENNYGDYIYISWDEASEDSIDCITTDSNSNGVVFNLVGVRVSDDYKGIVIKNGKKFMQTGK